MSYSLLVACNYCFNGYEAVMGGGCCVTSVSDMQNGLDITKQALLVGAAETHPYFALVATLYADDIYFVFCLFFFSFSFIYIFYFK
jgi:hypothetical protein